MKIAYLMLFHRDPQLLKMATRMLTSEDCEFFVHIDRKSDIRKFSAIGSDNVLFCEPRIPVYWAEFSEIVATRVLLRQALASSANFDYFIFLQGSTYPLRSGSYIRRFLEKNRGLEFINLVKMPAPGYPMSKINIVRYPSDKPVRRFGARALAKAGLAQRDYRKYFRGLEPFSGHACWILSRDASQFLMDFDAASPHLEAYFQNTFVPEESFFHTILGNSEFQPRIRKNLVYADWSASEGHHPVMITEEHVKFFESQEKVWVEDEWGAGEMLFARKFSDDRLDLVERIDEMIKKKEGLTTTSLPSANWTSNSL